MSTPRQCVPARGDLKNSLEVTRGVYLIGIYAGLSGVDQHVSNLFRARSNIRASGQQRRLPAPGRRAVSACARAPSCRRPAAPEARSTVARCPPAPCWLPPAGRCAPPFDRGSASAVVRKWAGGEKHDKQADPIENMARIGQTMLPGVSVDW